MEALVQSLPQTANESREAEGRMGQRVAGLTEAWAFQLCLATVTALLWGSWSLQEVSVFLLCNQQDV